MRILFATNGYVPAFRLGGPIYSVSALAEELVRQGHDVTVFATNSNFDEDLEVPIEQPVDINGVRVWYFRYVTPLKDFLSTVSIDLKSIGFLYAPNMKARLDEVAPSFDVIHAHMPFAYPGFASARAALRHHKPLFWHQRGSYDPEALKFSWAKKKLYLRFAELPVVRRATTVVALTAAEAEHYRALGIRVQCAIVPNGINLSEFGANTQPLPAEWALPSNAKILLFMSRLHPKKGLDVLIDAFPRILSEVPNAHLVCAGPDEMALLKTFRARAEKQNSLHRIRFVGMVTGRIKRALLARADLFCLPSRTEGFSMAVLEALASGAPVLLSANCNFPEVQAAGAGRICSRNAEGIASTAIELLSDQDRLRAMRASATALASAYDWKTIARRMVAVYEEGIARFARVAT